MAFQMLKLAQKGSDICGPLALIDHQGNNS